MEYKNDIKSVTTKDYLTFDELTNIIVRGYGEEKEDGVMVMDGEKVKSYLRSILGDESSVTAAISVYNSPQLQESMYWRYDVKGGQGILISKLSSR